MIQDNHYLYGALAGFVVGIVFSFGVLWAAGYLADKSGKYMPGPFARPDWDEYEAKKAEEKHGLSA